MADFTNTISNAVPGLGTPSQRQVQADRNQAAGTGVSQLAFSPGIRKGIARVRLKGSVGVPPSPPTTGVVVTSFNIAATDGTGNYVITNQLGPLTIANQMLDMMFPFNLDIVATAVNLTITTTGGAAFIDFEVSGGG